MSELMNYDPNLTYSGRMARQTVRLTFGKWDYRATTEVEVGGNCRGLTVIECAISNFLETLPTREWDDELSVLTLTRTGVDGETDELECEDEDSKYDDWLKDMLIGAEIVAIRPDDRKR